MTDNEIIEEAIRLVEEGVSVTLPVNGRSMLPFIIGGRESVILQQPPTQGEPRQNAAPLKVGDVVLAWVEGNRYVVHRIIRDCGGICDRSEDIYWQYTEDYENKERICAARGVRRTCDYR